ncbi:predicted protein [Histoplasma capsulatum G186AR]|uniref:Uncharacterized protein n=1 Tax=Ajellomyces capsulatus (strain G186AR / H82 / ATCC MYA-2454 / RMSCC 2432) TaxID=447093 RepID=C0NUC1_AJECG|nr:uncharacterized protein HCBG_06952 [Histoplasma capsulatum G186AR]EEH05001.1 predicted protein [Histoplasma capsulatum G186AR]
MAGVSEDMDHRGTGGRVNTGREAGLPDLAGEWTPISSSIETFSRTGSADGGLCLGKVWASDSPFPNDPKSCYFDEIPVLIADWVEPVSTMIPGFLEENARLQPAKPTDQESTGHSPFLACTSFSTQRPGPFVHKDKLPESCRVFFNKALIWRGNVPLLSLWSGSLCFVRVIFPFVVVPTFWAWS